MTHSEIDNRSITYFISDLHLNDANPNLTKLFTAFIEGPAKEAKALYILGDLFNFWIGDDIPTQTSETVKKLLKTLSQTTSIYFMGGNRDFLVGPFYAKECGMTLLKEPTLLELDITTTDTIESSDELLKDITSKDKVQKRKVLLVHGDSLCTKDKGYMALRAVLRSRLGTHYFLFFPKAMRAKIAELLRNSSKKYVKTKSEIVMDVTPEAVVELMQAYQVKTLIHGHIHKEGIHTHQIPSKNTLRIQNNGLDGSQANSQSSAQSHTLKTYVGTRYVMSDWHDSGSILKFDSLKNSFEIISFKVNH